MLNFFTFLQFLPLFLPSPSVMHNSRIPNPIKIQINCMEWCVVKWSDIIKSVTQNLVIFSIILRFLWSEIFFFVFLSLVMSAFRNCQKWMMLKRENFDFLLFKVRIWQPKVGPFCARPKRMKLQCRDIGNCSDDFIATFRLLYVGTFTGGHISFTIWDFTCKKISFGNSHSYRGKVG